MKSVRPEYVLKNTEREVLGGFLELHQDYIKDALC